MSLRLRNKTQRNSPYMATERLQHGEKVNRDPADRGQLPNDSRMSQKLRLTLK